MQGLRKASGDPGPLGYPPCISCFHRWYSMMNGKHRLPENITHTPAMKASIILLYLILAVQSLIIIVAFKFGADSMRAAFRYSQESIIEICDQRYQPR